MINEELERKIIENQDCLAYFIRMGSFSEAIKRDKKFYGEDDITFEKAEQYVYEHPEIIKNFSIENVYNVYTSSSLKEREKEIAKGILLEKLKTENFSSKSGEVKFGIVPACNSLHSWKSTDEEVREAIRENIKRRVLAIDNPKKVDDFFSSARMTYLDAANFLKSYENGDINEEKFARIQENVSKNPAYVKNLNFEVFNDDVYQLGGEFVDYVSRFLNVSNALTMIRKNNPEIFKMLAEKIKSYDDVKDNFEELQSILFGLEFAQKNMSLEDNPDAIFEWALNEHRANQKNFLNTQYYNVPYSRNYMHDLEVFYDNEAEKLVNEKRACEADLAELSNEDYYSGYWRKNAQKKISKINEKLKNIYMNKVCSLSYDDATLFLKEYATDMKNVSLNDETRQKIEMIQEALERVNAADVNLEEMIKGSKNEMRTSEIFSVKKECTRAFAQDYKKVFAKLDDRVNEAVNENNQEQVSETEVDGKKVKVVRLNGEFNLLMHSTDANFVGENTHDNSMSFNEYWFKEQEKTNHLISTTYVTNNLFGIPPVGENGVIYGFSASNSERIKIMGVSDINTYMNNVAYSSSTKQYMSASTMDRNARRVYSEFAIEREGATPDYVVLTEDMTDAVRENTMKAAADFNIPVLFFDKKEIVKEQIDRLGNELNRYKETQDIEVLKNLINLYETNVAGWLLNRNDDKDESHTSMINNDRFKQDFDNAWQQISECIDNGISNAVQSKDAEELTRLTQIILSERDLYEGAEKAGPITKTKLSFDANEILGKINDAFETVGASNRKIDMENIPTLKTYNVSIKQIAESALREGIEPRKIERDKTKEI